MPLSKAQEREIYPILDKAMELDPGKAVLHKCTAKRSDYLTRTIQGLRYDTAIESILMYEPNHPLYGRGMYATLWVEAAEQGLVAANLPEPYDNLMWRLIQCAATKKTVLLTGRSGSARQRLIRAQKKYPEVMGVLWIRKDPFAVCYANVDEEELIIVDIDINPTEELKAPTPEQKAKDMQHNTN